MDKKELCRASTTGVGLGLIFGVAMHDYLSGLIFTISYILGYMIVTKIRKR